MFERVRLRLRCLWRKRETENELKEEPRSHLEREIERNVHEGMNPEGLSPLQGSHQFGQGSRVALAPLASPLAIFCRAFSAPNSIFQTAHKILLSPIHRASLKGK